MLNMKITVIEIKHCQLKNILERHHQWSQKSDTWNKGNHEERQLQLIFFSSKDNHEERVIHSKSDNILFMIYDNADEIIEELFESLLNRYQSRLETLMIVILFLTVFIIVLQMS